MNKIYIAVAISSVVLAFIVLAFFLIQSVSETPEQEINLETIDSNNTDGTENIDTDPSTLIEQYPTDIPEDTIPNFKPRELTEQDIDEIMQEAIERGEDPDEVRYYLEQQVGHYEEEFDEDDPLEMVELINFPIENKTNLKREPLHMYIADEEGYVYSPRRQHSARIEGDDIIITDIKTSTPAQTLQLENDTQEAVLAWLREDLLLVVEKEFAETKIDRAYMLELDSTKKTYLVGSFPVYTRFNLQKNLEVFNNGKVVIISDNEDMLWKLEIDYRQ
jgi:hypothetical protein